MIKLLFIPVFIGVTAGILAYFDNQINVSCLYVLIALSIIYFIVNFAMSISQSHGNDMIESPIEDIPDIEVFYKDMTSKEVVINGVRWMVSLHDAKEGTVSAQRISPLGRLFGHKIISYPQVLSDHLKRKSS